MRGVIAIWLFGVVLPSCGGITERQVDEPAGGRDASAASGSIGGRGEGDAPSKGGAGGAGGVGGTSSGASSRGGSPSVPRIEGSACYSDVDCPGSECGGQVCDWTRLSPTPTGEKLFYCAAAGTAPQGRDGWCTRDEDCKCRGRGATCIAPFCTFTRPEDAP